MRRKDSVLTACAILVLALGAAAYWTSRPPAPVNPVTASGGPETVLMDFSSRFPLAPPPLGWWHRTFWTRAAMEITFEERSGITGLVCRTQDSASIFGRFTDIALADYPYLAWTWRMDKPIETSLDERSREGDDHPIRLFLTFRTPKDEHRAMEIIWSNGAIQEGDYKYIGDFPHYVAQSGTASRGQWIDEKIDLSAIYRSIWKSDDAPVLSSIGLFCDSDDTGGHSEAALRRVVLQQ